MFWFRTSARLCLVVGTVWIASTVTAANAMAASCSYANVTPVFAPWQDAAEYTPFQGSSFESARAAGRGEMAPRSSRVTVTLCWAA